MKGSVAGFIANDTETSRQATTCVRALILVLADIVVGERVAASLDGQCKVLVVRGVVECRDALGRYHFACAIVEISGDRSQELGSAVRVIRYRSPTTRIIGYVSADQQTAGPLMVAARNGLDDLVFRAERDMITLRECVFRHVRGSPEDLDSLTNAVCTRLPPQLHAIVRRCLIHVTASGGVSELAASLRWHRNTLAIHLHRLGGPRPERFRAWCLLLRIGYLLDETSLSIERIALSLGFSSASAVSHLASRYLSTTPSDLRAVGAVRTITAKFASECSEQAGLTTHLEAGGR